MFKNPNSAEYMFHILSCKLPSCSLHYKSRRMGATVVVQPLDLLKNRMQLSGEGGAARAHKTVFHTGMSVFKEQGVPGLYKG